MMKLSGSCNLFTKVMTHLFLLVLLSACKIPSVEVDDEPSEDVIFEKELLRIHGGKIPLEEAISFDLVSYVSAEINKQGTASIIVDDSDRWTALHHACLHNSPKTVRLLLSQGADPNIRDTSGKLPIGYAFYNEEILKILAAPDEPFEPRSVEAEEAAALEAFFQYLALREEAVDAPGDEYFLEINGRVVSTNLLEVLRGHGFKVFSGPETADRDGTVKVRVGMEWISDTEAEIWIAERFYAEKGTITYAYGHWMLDIHEMIDIF